MAYSYRIIREHDTGEATSIIVVVGGKTAVVTKGQANFAGLLWAIENAAPDGVVVGLLDNQSIVESLLKSSEDILNEESGDPFGGESGTGSLTSGGGTSSGSGEAFSQSSPLSSDSSQLESGEPQEEDDEEFIDCPVCEDGMVDCDNCDPGDDDCVVCGGEGHFDCDTCGGMGAVPNEPVSEPINFDAPTEDEPEPKAKLKPSGLTGDERSKAWKLSKKKKPVRGGEYVTTKKASGFSIQLKDGKVHINGIPMDNNLTELILRYATNGEPDKVRPLALFLGRLMQNPSQRSREMLFDFLIKNQYVLAPDGRIYTNKSVTSERLSHSSGREDVTVIKANGDQETQKGKIKYEDGSVISMDRELVRNDREACGVGLHVGSKHYTTEVFGNAGDIHLLMLVAPEDVVSVPTDHGSGKMRACRIEVVGPSKTSKHEKGSVPL